ncbi:MAG: YbaN family protein [Coriobacteriia bacterium]|nr:YbaN family protein [Coriobacteriia bacterium]
MKHVLKYICLAIGLIALALGIIGIFVPMWPTTPFLLLAAACFVRSSERLYTWLIEHRHLGCYVRDYMSGKGIPLRAKWISLGLMWVTSQASWMIVMAHRGVQPWTIGYAVLLVVVAIGVHYHIGFRIPTRRPGCEETES